MLLERLKPLGNKLLVKLLPLYSSEKISFISQKHHWEHATRRAEVLAAGPKVHEVKANDQVIFHGHLGKWVDPPGSEGFYSTESDFRMLKESDVLAVVDGAC